MACKYIYEGVTYNSKEEFISRVIPTLQEKTLSKFDKIPTNKKVYESSIKNYEENILNFEKAIEAIKNNNFKIILPNNVGRYVASVEAEGVRGGTIPIAENPYTKEAKNGNFDKEYALSYLKERIKKEKNFIESEKEKIKDIENVEKNIYNKNINSNSFLHLLSRDNNWVTFFIKSIIQDSAKKGYEKVLFPSGNTASKVEGHTTLEEFKKQKEDRIKELEKELKKENDNYESNNEYDDHGNLLGNYSDQHIEALEIEINQLKQELENLDKEGFGALKPIYNFYENTVTNILNKTYGKDNVKVITDEYGNTWNEIRITPDLNTKVFIQQQEEEFLPQDPKIESAVKGIMSQLGIRLEAYDEYAQWYEMTYGKPLHAVGIADMMRGVIAIDEGRSDKFTSLEELSHFVLYALKDDKRVIEALSLIESTEEWKNHSEAYIAEYEGDMEMVRLEILGKILKKQLGNAILDEKPIWKRRLELLWNRFLQFFNFGNKVREVRIKNSLDSIINDVMRGKTEKIRKGIQKGKGVFMQVEDNKKGSKDSKYDEFKKLFENSKLLDSMDKELKESMKLIYDRLQDVKSDGIESLIDREKKIYTKLVKDHADQKVTRGIISYISHVEEGSDHIIKEVDRLRDEYDAGELNTDTVGFVKVLADMKKYISLYEDSISGLTAKVRRHKHRTDSTDTTSEKVEALLNALLNIRSGMDVMNNTYEEYSKKLFMDTHRNLVMKDAFYATPEERNAKLADIQSQLDRADDSMWPINAWVQSVAESKDDILMLTDRTYKQLDGLINLESEDDSKTIINAFVDAQEAGMLDTEWMFERDADGNITGNFITSINHAKAEKAIHDFFVQLRRDFILTQDPEVENIEFRIAELKNIVSELESGKRKPSLDVNSPTQVTNADEYFGGSMITASGSSASKEKTIEYFNNRIAYLEKNKEKSYTKREAHMRRVIERSHIADTPELLAYNKKIAQFFTDNFEKNPEWQKIYQDKRDSVYREILPLKKDRETVQRLKDTYGKDKWQLKLIEENRDLALKVKRAEKILNEWRNERRVEVSFDGKTVMSYRREFALPKQSIYGNSAFTDAMKDPVKKKFYDAWLKMRTEKVAHMTPEYRYSTLMPQIRKDTLERLKTDPTKTATELMKDAFTVRADETERGRIDATGQKVKQVPLFFMNPLEDMNELSLDATATMIAFADTANRHRYLSRMVDTAEMTADILRTRKLYKKSGELSTTGGNPYRMYREYIDMRLYGEWKKTETWEGYDMGKMADALNRYSAMSTLALNAFAGISNVVLGNSLIRQEAFANEFVDHKDVMYADTVYWDVRNGVTDLMGDVGKLRSNNKLRLFIERFNLLRDHKERMRDVNADRSRFGRMFDMSAFFFVNHAGEHQMQSRLGLALAHKKKVLNEKGEEIPFYEAFDVENYKLILKEGMKNLDGSPITNEDFESFMTKAGHINNKLHGIYNDADKAMYQRYAIGRIVGLYRKWLAPGINRRWKGRYHDWILETDVEGFYTTAISFFKQLFLELRQGQFTFASIGTNYDKLKDFEKANLARALGEVAMMMIALAAAVLLEMFAEAIDDDDEYAAWAVNMSAYQANRYFTETMFYLPVLGTLEQLKIINSPAAAVDQISHIMSIGKIIDPFGALIEGDDIFPRYERGRHKNDLKAYVWGRDMVPLASTVEDFFYPEDRLKYFSN